MGRVWSSIPVAFFKFKQQPQLYRMYTFHRQFIHDQLNTFSNLIRKKKGRKKTIKKAS